MIKFINTVEVLSKQVVADPTLGEAFSQHPGLAIWIITIMASLIAALATVLSILLWWELTKTKRDVETLRTVDITVLNDKFLKLPEKFIDKDTCKMCQVNNVNQNSAIRDTLDKMERKQETIFASIEKLRETITDVLIKGKGNEKD